MLTTESKGNNRDSKNKILSCKVKNIKLATVGKGNSDSEKIYIIMKKLVKKFNLCKRVFSCIFDSYPVYTVQYFKKYFNKLVLKSSNFPKQFSLKRSNVIYELKTN